MGGRLGVSGYGGCRAESHEGMKTGVGRLWGAELLPGDCRQPGHGDCEGMKTGTRGCGGPRRRERVEPGDGGEKL